MKAKDLTNIPEGTCECSVCKTVKDNIHFSFYKTRLTKDGYRLRVNTYCDPCARATSKELSEIKKTLLKDQITLVNIIPSVVVVYYNIGNIKTISYGNST